MAGDRNGESDVFSRTSVGRDHRVSRHADGSEKPESTSAPRCRTTVQSWRLLSRADLIGNQPPGEQQLY